MRGKYPRRQISNPIKITERTKMRCPTNEELRFIRAMNSNRKEVAKEKLIDISSIKYIKEWK